MKYSRGRWRIGSHPVLLALAGVLSPGLLFHSIQERERIVNFYRGDDGVPEIFSPRRRFARSQ